MQGKIYQSCGHEDYIRPVAGWPLKVKGEDCDAVDGLFPCIHYYHYCLKCYIEALEQYPELIIFNEWEQQEYFDEWDNLNGKT